MKATAINICRLIIMTTLTALCSNGCVADKEDPTVSSIDITSAEDYEKLHADTPEDVISHPAKAEPSETKQQKQTQTAIAIENSGAESPAYDLGRRCAMRLIRQCETESAVRDELLDIRAREYSLRTQISDEAADAYLSGFKSALKESGDTLYATLFE